MGNTLEPNFRNTMTHSAECLRKAVPLMVKYNIAVTPANYALWYSYVSGNHPNLNVKLDAALRTYGTCPPALSRELFEEFLSDKDLELFDNVVDNIEDLFDQVNQDMSLTIGSTKDFSQILQECNQDLSSFQEAHRGEQNLLHLVDKLAEESRIMQDVAVQFQSRLENAQKEINKLRTELTESKQQASKDMLTGLNNRRVFDEDVVMMCSSKQQAAIIQAVFNVCGY
jgi:diguanylate cyclase